MKSNEEKQLERNLPTVVEVLDQLMKPGTVLEFPGKPIQFDNSKQTAVKSLAVKICSTESQDMAILHKLYTRTRNT